MKLGNNPLLSGCVPIPSYLIEGGELSGTNIDGICDPGALEFEKRQQQAAVSVLPKVIWSTGSSNANAAVKQLLSWMSNIGNQVGDWEDRKEVRVGGEPGSPAVSITFKVFNGTECLQSLAIYGSRLDPPISLNLSLLAEFVEQMPQIEQFQCDGCNGAPGQRLPTTLAAAAPRMRVLKLRNCSVEGALPASWGNWSGLEELDLAGNRITGTLPGQYATMRSLQHFRLDNNMLQGTLPGLWGEADAMLPNVSFYLQGNKAMHGTVPAAWAHFSSGNLYINNTQIGGCSPGGLYTDFILPRCLSSAAPLLALRSLLEASTTGTPTDPITGDVPTGCRTLSSWMYGAYTQPICAAELQT